MPRAGAIVIFSEFKTEIVLTLGKNDEKSIFYTGKHISFSRCYAIIKSTGQKNPYFPPACEPQGVFLPKIKFLAERK